MSELVFYGLAALMLLSAVAVVGLRNPVHCALALIAHLCLIAVSFAFLGAHLMAALQIIIYAGAVVVLFLFVIMLLNLGSDPGDRSGPGLVAAAVTAAAAMAGLVGVVVWRGLSLGEPGGRGLARGDGFGSTVEFARYLFREHVVAFELTSVLLLVAVVGAVVMARRDPDELEG
ncbi:MAG: NADH-quinone oxidoreductase subunit J [Candidatus Binatia bacterium]